VIARAADRPNAVNQKTKKGKIFGAKRANAHALLYDRHCAALAHATR
jgi:hypothetical protein